MKKEQMHAQRNWVQVDCSHFDGSICHLLEPQHHHLQHPEELTRLHRRFLLGAVLVAIIWEEEAAIANCCTHWLIVPKHAYLDQRKVLPLPPSFS